MCQGAIGCVPPHREGGQLTGATKRYHKIVDEFVAQETLPSLPLSPTKGVTMMDIIVKR